MGWGPALAHIKDLRLTLGVAPLFENVSFVLHKGARAALVGANGAGKSTLMRMLAGHGEPDSGAITYASGVAVAYARQDPDLEGCETLRDYACAPSARLSGREHTAPAYAAEAELAQLGLDPDRSPANLSGGEMRRASLARALAANPDLLLLDEPTNHLDITAIEALEQRIAGFNGACLIISHDRRFLERVTNTTLWLRQRQVLSSESGFSAFDNWAERVEVEETRQAARLETHLRTEEHWLRRGVTGRRARNEGRRRKLEALRAERKEQKARAATPRAALQAEKGAESSKLAIEAKRLTKAYAGRAIVTDLNLRIMRGDRVGVVGPNGAGKTTLLELLLRQRESDAGEVRLAGNLGIAYVDQARAIINPNVTLWDALAPLGGDQVMVRGKPKHIAAYAAEFLFSPQQLRQPVGALSGGERNRLALAIALARPANLLVLDEPTNDLDMDTLDALEEMLAAYDGTVILVSHDRAFLDGVATQVIGPLGNGRWVESPGGWSDFEREYGGFLSIQRAPQKPRAKPTPAQPRKTTKLSYKEERRATELDARVPELHATIAKLEADLADANAFARNPDAFRVAAVRLEALRAEHAAAEAEWLEIELKREALAAEE
jgi:ATP-binding cassette subfamily F protein uup